jgi:hypothetical protein
MKTTKCIDCPKEAKPDGVLCQGCWDATVKPGASARITEPPSVQSGKKSWGARVLEDGKTRRALVKADEDEQYALDHIDHGEPSEEVTGPRKAYLKERGTPDRYRELTEYECLVRRLAYPGPYWRYSELGKLGAYQSVRAPHRNVSSPEERTEQFRRLLRKELKKSANAGKVAGAVLAIRLDTASYPSGEKTGVSTTTSY